MPRKQKGGGVGSQRTRAYPPRKAGFTRPVGAVGFLFRGVQDQKCPLAQSTMLRLSVRRDETSCYRAEPRSRSTSGNGQRLQGTVCEVRRSCNALPVRLLATWMSRPEPRTRPHRDEESSGRAPATGREPSGASLQHDWGFLQKLFSLKRHRHIRWPGRHLGHLTRECLGRH